jgi:SAM-dependent methyltransferase
MHGERLEAAFPSGYFDAVNCANALDHFYDPIRAVHQMLAVTRAGGVVRVISRENEGQRGGYWGLHQWNICQQGDDVRIWNRQSVDVRWREEFREATITSHPISAYMQRTHDPPLLVVLLRKRL